MYQGGTFLRQTWKHKPKQWGPWKAVHTALFHNAKNICNNPNLLEYASPMWSGYEYSKNNNIGTIISGVFKRGGFVPGSVSQPMQLSNTIDLASDEEYTIVVKFIIDSGYNTTLNAFLGRLDTDNYFGLITSGSTVRVQDNASVNYDDSISVFVGKSYTLVYKQYGSNHATYPNDFEYFIDGASLGITNGTSTVAPRFRIDTIGNGYTDASYRHKGVIEQVLIYRGELTNPQIKRISDNPWQLWQPAPQIFYSIPATGGSTLLPIIMLEMNQFNGGIT